jgi:hypothetical protein
VALLRWKICCRQITVMVSWFRYTQPNRTITEVGWPNPTNGPNYTHYDGHDLLQVQSDILLLMLLVFVTNKRGSLWTRYGDGIL